MFAPRGDAQERAGPASRGRGGAGLGTEAASIVRAASEGRAAHAPQADDRGGQPQVVSGSRRRGSPSAGVAAPGDARRTPLCQRGNLPRPASFDYNTIVGPRQLFNDATMTVGKVLGHAAWGRPA
jgi:hypothetical protein